MHHNTIKRQHVNADYNIALVFPHFKPSKMRSHFVSQSNRNSDISENSANDLFLHLIFQINHFPAFGKSWKCHSLDTIAIQDASPERSVLLQNAIASTQSQLVRKIIHLCNKNIEQRANKQKVFSYADGLLVGFKRAGPRWVLWCASMVNACCRKKNKVGVINLEVQVKEAPP